MRAQVLGLALAFCGVCQAQQTQAPPTAEAMTLLRKIYLATERLSYSGTFVYQQGERSETSRIDRVSSPGGDIERLEVLDGMPREMIRSRDMVRCYIPESQTVKVEKRIDQRAFTGMLPEQIAQQARTAAVLDDFRGRATAVHVEDVRPDLLGHLRTHRHPFRLAAEYLHRERTFFLVKTHLPL